MRTLLAMVVALALCAFPRLADAQTPGSWFVEVSVAHVYGLEGLHFDVRHLAGSGVAWNATVGRRTLPWLAITGDVGVLHVDELLVGSFIPEDSWTLDDATHAT